LEEADSERLRYLLDFFIALEDLPVSCNRAVLDYRRHSQHAD
jgi:hypothetical protein